MRAAALAALFALPSLAIPEPAKDEPRFETELVLEVGDTAIVASGPVQRLVCDRGDVVERAITDQGNGFRALAAGETTCSLQTADGVRRTFHVKVVPARR
jgi:hypothetical protein